MSGLGGPADVWAFPTFKPRRIALETLAWSHPSDGTIKGDFGGSEFVGEGIRALHHRPDAPPPHRSAQGGRLSQGLGGRSQYAC